MTKTIFALLCCAPLALVACGGSDSSSNDDLSTKPDQSATADMTKVPDLLFENADMAGFQLVETCGFGDFIDERNNTGTIAVSPWDPSLGRKCLLISVGQTVHWESSSTHPLESTTGTTPTPIPAPPGMKAAAAIKFDNIGVYGFQCAVHTSLMHGAIWVVQ